MKTNSFLPIGICNIVFWWAFLLPGGIGQEEKKNASTHNDSISEQVELLKLYYSKINDSLLTEYEQNYFEVFPASFKSFNNILGDSASGSIYTHFEFKPGPLYHDSYSYIKTFFNLDIEKSKYYTKMIKISLDGHWAGDAVSIFQELLAEEVNNNLSDFIPLLAEYTDEVVKSFWYFLYDGPHPDHPLKKKLYNSLEIRLLEKNSRVAELMEQAYTELLARGGCSGH